MTTTTTNGKATRIPSASSPVTPPSPAQPAPNKPSGRRAYSGPDQPTYRAAIGRLCYNLGSGRVRFSGARSGLSAYETAAARWLADVRADVALIDSGNTDWSHLCADGQKRHTSGLADYLIGADNKARAADIKALAVKPTA